MELLSYVSLLPAKSEADARRVQVQKYFAQQQKNMKCSAKLLNPAVAFDLLIN